MAESGICWREGGGNDRRAVGVVRERPSAHVERRRVEPRRARSPRGEWIPPRHAPARMLGDRRRRAVGVLKRVAIRPNRLGREILDRCVLAEKRDQGPVHGGLRPPRLRRALTRGNLGLPASRGLLGRRRRPRRRLRGRAARSWTRPSVQDRGRADRRSVGAHVRALCGRGWLRLGRRADEVFGDRTGAAGLGVDGVEVGARECEAGGE